MQSRQAFRVHVLEMLDSVGAALQWEGEEPRLQGRKPVQGSSPPYSLQGKSRSEREDTLSFVRQFL